MQNLQSEAFIFNEIFYCCASTFAQVMRLLLVNDTTLWVGRGKTVLYLHQNQLPQRHLQKAQRPFVEHTLWMSRLAKWQGRIVCLTGGRRTMVQGGVPECNTLHQTRIYWFDHSAASPGYKSHFTVIPTNEGNLLPETELDSLKKRKWDMRYNVIQWIFQK